MGVWGKKIFFDLKLRMAETIIKIENLRHTYQSPEGGEIAALQAINLTIKAGEFVAVIGTNGSGKSTLAKHLNALLIPSSGKCLVKGMDTADMSSLWQIRQTVGMVFQNPDNQIVAAVVEEDVAFGPENLGVAPAEIANRVQEALAAVEMEDYRQHSPHLLSGGQKQRIAIAGVLAMRPQCLVLDEPTAMLDPRGRREVLNTVIKLNQTEAITIIYITHFMEEAVAADRVIVMEGGAIIAEGTPSAIFQDAERLKKLGLDVPVATQVSAHLRQKGLQVPAAVIKDEELVSFLCP
jgi:energy-coupling factor transport system ATP-binding protein